MYPRGIECDDTQTSARLDGGALVVEMPITKLPAIGAEESVAAASPPPVAAPEGGKKRKRPLPEATSGAVKKMAQSEMDSERATEATARSIGDRGPKKKRKQQPSEEPLPQHEASDDEHASLVAEKSRDKSKRGMKDAGKNDAGKRRSGGTVETAAEDGAPHAAKKAEPSDDRMRELLEQATSAAAQKRDAALGKMRRLEERDDEKTQKARAKQEERAAKKKLLLETFRRQQAAAKAESKAGAAVTRQPHAAEQKAALGSSRKKRVSFGSDV